MLSLSQQKYNFIGYNRLSLKLPPNFLLCCCHNCLQSCGGVCLCCTFWLGFYGCPPACLLAPPACSFGFQLTCLFVCFLFALQCVVPLTALYAKQLGWMLETPPAQKTDTCILVFRKRVCNKLCNEKRKRKL